MESDIVNVYGVRFPQRITGRIVRTLELNQTSVNEEFRFIFKDDEETDEEFEKNSTRGVIADSYDFGTVPATTPALVYIREIPGSHSDEFDPVSFFTGNLAADGGNDVDIDLTSTEPIDESAFWELLKILDGQVTDRRVIKLRRAIAELGESGIASFERRLRMYLAILKTQEVADGSGHSGVGLYSDSFLFWRLVAIARGPIEFDRVVGGGAAIINDLDESTGEKLALISEDAFESLTGVTPHFHDGHTDTSTESETVTETPSASKESEKALLERGPASVIDTRPGPRDLASLYERGLAPRVVGSRFLIAQDGAVSECIVSQRLDLRNENVKLHLREAADEIIQQIGGELVSPVEYFEANEHLWTGATVFVIRRRWKTTLDEYRERYGL